MGTTWSRWVERQWWSPGFGVSKGGVEGLNGDIRDRAEELARADRGGRSWKLRGTLADKGDLELANKGDLGLGRISVGDRV